MISQIQQVSERVFNRILDKAGIRDINPAQGRILFILWQKDSLSITELAKETLLHKSTLTKMLDRLEESGHVTREFDPSDRRVTIIRLTEKNRKLKRDYEAVSEEMRRIVYQGMSGAEIKQLDAQLSRMLSNLLKHEKELNPWSSTK